MHNSQCSSYRDIRLKSLRARFQTLGWLLLAVIVLNFPTGAKAAPSNAECFAQSWPQTSAVTAESLEQFLDCLASAQPLSRIGAQWLVLRRSHWRIAASTGSDVSYEFADNLGDPFAFHFLKLNFRGLTSDRSQISQYLSHLEAKIFPEALLGFSKDPAKNRTAVSFEASAHHKIAFSDFAMQSWVRRHGRENAHNHYPGTLAAAAGFPRSWHSEAQRDFAFAFVNTPEADLHWPALREQYQRFSFCEETLCLTRQERRVIQGLLLTLGNPDLVEAMHFSSQSGFGRQRGDYKGAQESLPQVLGCFGSTFATATTGWLEYNYSAVSDAETFRDLTAFSSWGLLGRTIYIEGLNKDDIERQGFPGQFQGQNSVIRKISDAAVRNLKQLGGFGDTRIDTLANVPEAVVTTTHEHTRNIIDQYLSGVSKLVAEYQWQRYIFELEYIRKSNGGKSASRKLWDQAVNASLNEFANHPVNQAPFFKETIITKGWSLQAWINLLHKLNPPVVYFVFLNEIGLRPKEAYGSRWDTYYDRLLFVLNGDYFAPLRL